MYSEPYPLPYGWVKEFDPSSHMPFYVDTRVSPPRSIWTHPYEDDQYLSEHPEVREKVSRWKPDNLQPPSFEEATRRHSFPGQSSTGTEGFAGALSDPDISKSGKQKRGFLGKLKDKVVGTKEEREASRRREEEHRRQMLEIRRQQMMYNNPADFGNNRMGGGMLGGTPQYGYGSSSMGATGVTGRRLGGGGGGGMVLPLLGGMVGGLLLGDIIDGGFGDGFGGGDFGGGGF